MMGEQPAWMKEATRVCAAAAQGDLEARILDIDQDSDSAALLNGINQLLDMTDAFVREACAALAAANDGAFYRRVLPAGMLGSFGAAAHRINDATRDMGHAASELEAAEAQRTALEDDFGRAREAAGSLSTAIAQILDHSQSIGTIARTSNMLALNASVEAARVGQAGAGFAVVADEVKRMADATRDATDRIQDDVNNVRDAASETAKTIDYVWDVIKSTSRDARSEAA